MVLNSTYTLAMDGRFVDDNGACARARPVLSIPYTDSGSTRGTDLVSLCSSLSPASWFSITSPDNYAQITITVMAWEFTPIIRAVTSCIGTCYSSGTETLSIGPVNTDQVLLIAVTGGEGDYSISISGELAVVYKAPVIICPSNLIVTASKTTCKFSGTTGTPSVISVDGFPVTYSKTPKAPYSISEIPIPIVYTAVHSQNSNLRSSCTQMLTVRRPANSQC